MSGPDSPLRGLAHKALVAAEIGVAAVVVVTAIDRVVASTPSSTAEPPAAAAESNTSGIEMTVSEHGANVTYRDDIATGTTFVDLVGGDGSIVAHGEVASDGVLTFGDLPADTYRIVFNHQFPISEDAEAGVGIGSQHILRSEPLKVAAGDGIVITLVDVGS